VVVACCFSENLVRRLYVYIAEAEDSMVEHGRPAAFDQETVSGVCSCIRSGDGKVCNTLAGPFDLFMSWAVGFDIWAV
jgi:hypothetical protein